MQNITVSNKFFKQPKSFYMIFMLEIWERFTYAGTVAVLSIYLIDTLKMSEGQSTILTGSFVALSYGLIVFGGWLGDKVIGIKRAIMIGMIAILMGFICLYFAGNKLELILLGLSIYMLGIGAFKSNPSTLLSLCYPKHAILDSIYTYYYMAINVGALLGFLIAPLVVTYFGYKILFIVLCAGIITAIITFIGFYPIIKNIDNTVGKISISYRRWIIYILALIVIVYTIVIIMHNNNIVNWILYSLFALSIIFYMISAHNNKTALEKSKMIVAFILIMQYMLYFMLYIQTLSSVTFFALHNVNLNLFSLHIDERQLNVFNALTIIICSPLLNFWYAKRDKNYSYVTKFAIGNILMGISFVLLYVSTIFHDNVYQVHVMWVLIIYIIFSVGELLIGAVGLSMIPNLVNEEHRSFTYGLWFLTGAVGMKIGSTIADVFSVPKNITDPAITLQLFAHLFRNLGVFITIIGIITIFFIKKLKSMLHKHL